MDTWPTLRIVNFQVGSEDLQELRLIYINSYSTSLRKNSCFRRWTEWYYTWLRFLPSLNPTLPDSTLKSPEIFKPGVGKLILLTSGYPWLSRKQPSKRPACSCVGYNSLDFSSLCDCIFEAQKTTHDTIQFCEQKDSFSKWKIPSYKQKGIHFWMDWIMYTSISLKTNLELYNKRNNVYGWTNIGSWGESRWRGRRGEFNMGWNFWMYDIWITN